MKTKYWAGLTLIVLIITGFVFAESQQGDSSREAAVRDRMQRVTPPGRAADAAGREEMYRQRMAQQTETHRAGIKELLDIKKIAEEENATRTVEAIQNLIDKKNAEFRKNVEQVERARRERSQRLQERTARAPSRPDAAADAEKADGTEKKD